MSNCAQDPTILKAILYNTHKSYAYTIYLLQYILVSIYNNRISRFLLILIIFIADDSEVIDYFMYYLPYMNMRIYIIYITSNYNWSHIL